MIKRVSSRDGGIAQHMEQTNENKNKLLILMSQRHELKPVSVKSCTPSLNCRHW